MKSLIEYICPGIAQIGVGLAIAERDSRVARFHTFFQSYGIAVTLFLYNVAASLFAPVRDSSYIPIIIN